MGDTSAVKKRLSFLLVSSIGIEPIIQLLSRRIIVGNMASSDTSLEVSPLSKNRCPVTSRAHAYCGWGRKYHDTTACLQAKDPTTPNKRK